MTQVSFYTGKLAENFFNLARLWAKTKVRHVLVHELLYADDAAFVAHSEADLQLLCSSFASACLEYGLRISLKKTVVLAQPATLNPAVSIDNKFLSVVDKFTYLGSTVSNTNNLDAELDMRIGKASSMFGKLSKRVWHNNNLALLLKVCIPYMCT